MKDKTDHDVIICGGGPAGLTAAVYAARAGLKAAVMEGLVTGGQAALPEKIENFPGYKSIDGFTLCQNMLAQAEALGVEIIYGQAVSTALSGKIKKIKTDTQEITARAVILAMGAKPRLLGLDNEIGLSGRGVSYCATCDGAFYKDKEVMVAGGGNTAAEDALYLSRMCRKVYLVHRRDTLRAHKITADKVVRDPKITVLWDSVITGLSAGKKLTGATVKNVKTGATHEIPCEGLFVAIGQLPSTDILKRDEPKILLDDGGYILTDEHMRTKIKGVFAAGDIRAGVMKQIVTACADGAVAADSASKYLQ